MPKCFMKKTLSLHKFVDTKNDFVCTWIVDEHSLYVTVPQYFNCKFCIPSNLEFKFKHVPIFVKIPFQHKSCSYMFKIIKSWHEISNNVVCATSKGSD